MYDEFSSTYVRSSTKSSLYISDQFSSVQPNCFYSDSYGNVINRNAALPMRHTDNNKHISFLLCTLYATHLDGQLYGFIHGLLAVLPICHSTQLSTKQHRCGDYAVCTPLCAPFIFAHLNFSLFTTVNPLQLFAIISVNVRSFGEQTHCVSNLMQTSFVLSIQWIAPSTHIERIMGFVTPEFL